MITKIKGACGYVEKCTYPKNIDIINELLSLGKTEFISRVIVGRLQFIRNKHNFFSEEFKTSFSKKLLFFSECCILLKNNQLPLSTGGLRDQCIIRLIGPFFKFQRKQRILTKKGKTRLPELEIESDDIWKLMEGYEISKHFVKELYWLSDSDMDGGFFEMLFSNFKNGKEFPKFLTE